MLNSLSATLRDGKGRIIQLGQDIAKAKRSGYPTDLAEASLAALRESLTLMIEHELQIRTSLERGKLPLVYR